jgi:hypothetical protein
MIITERCKKGHEQSAENVYVNQSTGAQRCRICHRIRNQRNNKKRAERWRRLLLYARRKFEGRGRITINKFALSWMREGYDISDDQMLRDSVGNEITPDTEMK